MMTNDQVFLKDFKTLESELITLAKLNDDFVSFSRALNKVYYDRNNPIICNPDVYEFLKTASDLRNILSHRNNVCQPSDEFVAQFKRIVKEVTHPLKCKDIATGGKNLIICHPGNLLFEVIEEMKANKLSHIPVISKGKIVGVFSRATFFDYYLEHKTINLTPDFTIQDFMDVITIDAHSNERYMFVTPNTRVYDIYKTMMKVEAKSRRISCIFVTDNGLDTGRLSGIITETDLLKQPVDII